MAGINGVKIKNVKNFRGHKGEPLVQGDVWVDGKKMGFWTQDGWRGPDMFHFDESCLKKAVADYKSGYEGEYADLIDKDIFMEAVAQLTSMEKDFRKKKRSHAILVTDKYNCITMYVDDEGDLLNKYAKYIEEMKSSLFEDKEHIVAVLDKDSFDIVVDGDHKAPKFL